MNCLGDQLRAVAARTRLRGHRERASPIAGTDWLIRRAGTRFSSSAEIATNDPNRKLTRLSRLEAVLFLAREPLGLRRLAQLANLTDATEARTLLTRLRERYDERGCAFQVAQVAGGYQWLSRPEFAAWLSTAAGSEHAVGLSPPALETLAVVAYRQPVLRAEVEAIRGVSCGEILRQLLDRDLLRIVGRSEELGRPLWYGTTKRFLQRFGLRNLDELPWADLRRPASQLSDDSPSHSADHGTRLTGDVDAA